MAKAVTTSISWPPDLLAAIDEEAAVERRDRSNLVQVVMEEYVAARRKERELIEGRLTRAKQTDARFLTQGPELDAWLQQQRATDTAK